MTYTALQGHKYAKHTYKIIYNELKKLQDFPACHLKNNLKSSVQIWLVGLMFGTCALYKPLHIKR